MRRVGTLIGAVSALGLAGTAVWLIAERAAVAHCDTLGGPVVVEAAAALAKGDVTPLLKWVKPAAESEIKAAFKRTLAVRANGPEAKELADQWFFETLVRVHRAGEDAPYTGLKPAGEIEPPVAAADKAIADGAIDELAKEVGRAAEHGVRERFAHVMDAKKHKDENVDAGREYVEAYVVFVHYVEGLHATIAGGAEHH